MVDEAFDQFALSTYKLKHPSCTHDANGNLIGTAIIRELVIILMQLGGTITRTRITVDF